MAFINPTERRLLFVGGGYLNTAFTDQVFFWDVYGGSAEWTQVANYPLQFSTGAGAVIGDGITVCEIEECYA